MPARIGVGFRACAATAAGATGWLWSATFDRNLLCEVDASLLGTAVASAGLGAVGGWYLAQPKKKKDILVVFGPSGAGKGTLIKHLFEEFGKSQVGFSVSHTTRKPRDGEENGVHYHFVKEDQMRADIAGGKFVEFAEVHSGKFYGTSIKAVQDV